MFTELKKTIMARDCMTEVDADCLVMEAKKQLTEYLEDGDFEGAHYICEEFFGLEPDYLFDLL